MKLFSSLKTKAAQTLESYKTQSPATYAAAEQAIGAVLIADGLFGLESPFGEKKRPGIIGSFVGIFVGALFVFAPHLFGSTIGLDDMTATTSATVVRVTASDYSTTSSGRTKTLCSFAVNYLVDGKSYGSSSSVQSPSYCALQEGQSIPISYNPANPQVWGYDVKTTRMTFYIISVVAVVILLSSIATFIIRLLSIIFGWKLIRDGRKNAAQLPADTNLGTIVSEIKKNFVSSVFGFGGVSITPVATVPKPPQAPPTPPASF